LDSSLFHRQKYVRQAVKDVKIDYPVAIDDEYAICRSLNWRKRTWQQYSIMMR